MSTHRSRRPRLPWQDLTLLSACLLLATSQAQAAPHPWPEPSAAAPAAPASGTQLAQQMGLLGVRWRVQELLGSPLGPAAGGARAPHLQLQAQHLRLYGSGGCNRLMGSFSLDGSRILFKRVARTMMSCPRGMDQERRLIETLGEVQRWHLEDRTLMLLNWQQQVLVKLVRDTEPAGS